MSAAVRALGATPATSISMSTTPSPSVCSWRTVPPAPFDARIRSRAEIEAVIGVELEVLIVRHAGIGVDAFQDDEVAAGHAGALEGAADHVPDAGANPRRAAVEE